MYSDLEKLKEIRKSLKHSWVPFFTKFGKLTPVQLETIPKILSGVNVILASPTASGKTEAVVAPVAERFINEKWTGLSILYIVPTRALANDTLSRVQGPLSDMEIKSSLRHGDKTYLSDFNLPNFLITTPESLDSLICRKSKIFSNLQTIILDEIHILDNTYRGDQLRLLLWRLKEIANNKNFSIHILSATLYDPSQIAQRYIDKFEVVKVGEERQIEYNIVNSLEEAYYLIKKEGFRKILFFCNMRESVEILATEIKKLWHPYPVVAHHGSLSKHEREEAEKIMKESDIAICVATSTLEIGIDIGDIDLIVLAEIPWSISSLLQRIGRGNRRKNKTYTLTLTTSPNEVNLIEAMFKTISSGVLPISDYCPDKSVVIQQIFSYLYQNPQGVVEETIFQLTSPLCSINELISILYHLEDKGWLEHRVHKWFASQNLMDLGTIGKIHSNIPDERKFSVIDVNSGKDIGYIVGVFDRVFALAGRIWIVESIDNNNNKIIVRNFKGKALPPIFKRCKNYGAFYYLLPDELKKYPFYEDDL